MTTAVLDPTPVDTLADTAAAMKRALRCLRPEHRAVLAQVRGHGRSLAEAAAALELPMAAVRTHLHQALRELHDVVGELGLTGPRTR